MKNLFNLVALGVTCLSLFTSRYVSHRLNDTSSRINDFSQQTSQLQNPVDSVSNISSDTESPQSLNSMEQSVYEQINRHREAKGLPPLLLDDWLSQQARKHSQAMARGDISLDREVLQQVNQKIINTGPYQCAGTAVGMNLGYANPAQTNVDYWLRDVYGDNPTTI
ncbi:CAP domain-containing protein [Aliterella atlantica]|uniref:SCP domain-containing protein n=1 Tax=Aliterella atlantica CENA595 TaxID=1618023 RepID=A0A0D8ZSB6_9CYAN|nr:CAP domain-containing protein [Aliterella atlantica]KJH71222.1 hypothetical protein UH38_13075 [Aliterella atlantica CENA595]